MKTADSTDIQEHYNPDEWRGTPDKLGHLCGYLSVDILFAC